MRKVLFGVVIGLGLGMAGAVTWDAAQYLSRGAAPSAQAVAKPLLGFSVDPSWVKSGTPNFRNVETVRSPDGKSVSGLWACDGPTTFEWTFYMDETVHLLEGFIEIEYQGKRFNLQPGDTATFHAGTKSVWHVPQHAKKAYTLHDPGRVAKLWRRVFPTGT
jgi:uncharacterized protein